MKIITITGIICITIIEIVALIKGHNGVILTMVIAAIAGAIGVAIPTPKMNK